MQLYYQKKQGDSYTTIKEVIKNYFGISDRLLIKLKKTHSLLRNGTSILHINETIDSNDEIAVLLDAPEETSILPTKMDLSILYEDDAYLVLDKPAGIPVHPSLLHYTDSLSNGIAFYFSQKDFKKKVRIVTRLDRNTSGLVIVAKNEYIQESLNRQMQNHTFIKKYLGIVEGKFEQKEGTIKAPIGRKENTIIEREVRPDGKDAITYYRVLQETKYFSLVEFTLETGRTHQIRVHSSYLGHPIIGDSLYGHFSPFINRQALHCHFVSFYHPITKKLVSYEASLPEDTKNLLEQNKNS